MIGESIFRTTFWVIFGGMILLQTLNATLDARQGEHGSAFHPAHTREGTRSAILRALRAIFLSVSLVLYSVNPAWMSQLAVPIPPWVRWIGVSLGVLSLTLYAWSRTTLGQQWSSHLLTYPDHQLVTTGPYARIRHPIYLAMLIFMTSITLVAASGLFVALFLFSLADLALRIPQEERMMIEVFGDEYCAYMQRTGKLLPKLWGYTSR